MRRPVAPPRNAGAVGVAPWYNSAVQVSLRLGTTNHRSFKREPAMSEAISVECPQCGAKLKLKNRNSVGKRVPCPKCKKPFMVKVPDADDDLEFMNVSEPDDEFAVPPDDDVAAQMSGRPPVRS